MSYTGSVSVYTGPELKLTRYDVTELCTNRRLNPVGKWKNKLGEIECGDYECKCSIISPTVLSLRISALHQSPAEIAKQVRCVSHCSI